MTHDTTKTLAKSALHFFSGTLLSRLTGGLRDLSMAICFGTHPEIASFMVAYRFSYLFRRLFGEGTLAGTFTPFFELKRGESARKGALFFRDLLFSSTVVLLLLIAAVEGVLAVTGQRLPIAPANLYVLKLTRIMLPGLLFICLFGLTSALLQCEKRYFIASASPVMFNLTWIFFVVFLKLKPPMQAVTALSIGVSLACLAQLLATLPGTWAFLKKILTRQEILRPAFLPKELRDVIKPMLLIITGVAATQINTAADALFARFASEEGPAYLWYAIRIQQLPVALFGVALSSALLPPLSRAMEQGDHTRFASLLQTSIVRAFSLIFPCSVALFVLGISGVNLLYGHGHFSGQSVYQTTLCLWSYGAGLIPIVYIILLAPAYYAGKEYVTPMIASVVSVLTNLLLNTLFVVWLHWGAYSVALATSVASFLNLYLLVKKLPTKERVLDKAFRSGVKKIALCTLAAGGTTLLFGHFVLRDSTLQILLGKEVFQFPGGVPVQLIHFSTLSLFYLLLFLCYAKLLKIELGLKFFRKDEPTKIN